MADSGVDLDLLAAGYRHRPASAASRARAVRAAAGLSPGSRVLDIGGGCGGHAAVWAGRGLQAVVLDRSAYMLATVPDEVMSVQGDGLRTPFRDGAFRLVLYHLAIHYLPVEQALREAFRLLAGQGRLWIWTMTPPAVRRSHLARWFPRVADIDGERFVESAELNRAVVAAGFRINTEEPEVEWRETTAGEWMDAAAQRYVSTLQLLTDAELAAGLRAFGSEHRTRREKVRYPLRFHVVGASKPQLR